MPEMQGHLQLQCVHVSPLTFCCLFSIFVWRFCVNLNRAPFRKQRGHLPTGILSTTAKATGFSSVSEMLLKSDGHLNHENVGVSLENVGILTELHMFVLVMY